MTKMTREAASRIQRAACIAGEGVVASGSFAARAMSAAYKNEPLMNIPSATGLCLKLGIFAVAATGAALSYYIYSSNFSR